MTGAERAALVTGASTGIAAAICRRLAGTGVGILVHARSNQDGAEATADWSEAERLVLAGYWTELVGAGGCASSRAGA